MKNSLAINIAHYRKLEKLTQKDLAAQIGTTPNNIGHWEKGRTEPNADFILKLAEIFGLTTDDLLK